MLVYSMAQEYKRHKKAKFHPPQRFEHRTENHLTIQCPSSIPSCRILYLHEFLQYDDYQTHACFAHTSKRTVITADFSVGFPTPHPPPTSFRLTCSRSNLNSS